MNPISAPVAPAREILCHGTRAQLELVWQDGEPSCIDFKQLRAQCRCADCRSSAMRGHTVRFEGVSVTDVQLFGVVGLRLFFSDGHDRGIFPWAYLKELGAPVLPEKLAYPDVSQTREPNPELDSLA